MKRQLFIFDLDGTLIDSREDLATAANLMRAHYGLAPLPVETVSRYVGNGVRKLVERALQGFRANLDEAVALHRAFYREHLTDRTALYPGVAKGLALLHRSGHLLALATNKPFDACERILDHFGIRRLFGSVLGGGSTENLKPHPEMILLTMQRLGMEPADTWMVGDHATDIESARQAEVQSIYLPGGMGNAGEAQPTRTYAGFADFVKAFTEVMGPPPSIGSTCVKKSGLARHIGAEQRQQGPGNQARDQT